MTRDRFHDHHLATDCTGHAGGMCNFILRQSAAAVVDDTTPPYITSADDAASHGQLVARTPARPAVNRSVAIYSPPRTYDDRAARLGCARPRRRDARRPAHPIPFGAVSVLFGDYKRWASVHCRSMSSVNDVVLSSICSMSTLCDRQTTTQQSYTDPLHWLSGPTAASAAAVCPVSRHAPTLRPLKAYQSQMCRALFWFYFLYTEVDTEVRISLQALMLPIDRHFWLRKLDHKVSYWITHISVRNWRVNTDSEDWGCHGQPKKRMTGRSNRANKTLAYWSSIGDQ